MGWLILIAAMALLLGVGVTVGLVRMIVHRVREYSQFATRVAGGELNIRTLPRGRDELTDLGWSLNEMVARGEEARAYQESQHEFSDAMQVTESEDEAHALLKRHLERSIPGSTSLVLNRNNSADRLEVTTDFTPSGDLAERLVSAEPKDCLAVRMGRSHRGAAGADPLMSCVVCDRFGEFRTCTPLLVGGEVIGSVLLSHAEPLTGREDTRVIDSVTQAAPVLANLRNLAIAELRAATDSLTGLPNTRAVQDTLKRLVAQASRVVWPLGAVLLDLDHFKEINDTYGHGTGDEVLAAVGVALQSAVRASDFVGRHGGEEFVMLLPNTGRAEAVHVAERVRSAIAEIHAGERSVTGSLGIAMFPDDATDVTRLMRNADRALYRAKANGRNRVEVFSMAADEPDAVGPGGPESVERRTG